METKTLIEDVLRDHVLCFGPELAVGICSCRKWEGEARMGHDLHDMHHAHVAAVLRVSSAA